MANQVVWFDIPVLDLDRAIQFYNAVLNCEIHKDPGGAIARMKHGQLDVSGCLVLVKDNPTSGSGPLLYFNVNGRLDAAVFAALGNKGQIVEAKRSLGLYGSRAIVLDSEGNCIALHSMKD